MIIIMDRFISKSLKLWTLLAATMNLLLIVAVANDGNITTELPAERRPNLFLQSANSSAPSIMSAVITTTSTFPSEILSQTKATSTMVSAISNIVHIPTGSNSSAPIIPYSFLLKSNKTLVDEVKGPRKIVPHTKDSSLVAKSLRNYDNKSVISAQPLQHDSGESKVNDTVFVENSTTVVAQLKSNALLSCYVKNSGDGVTVSWIRRKDYHLLTVGLQTYSSDDRFQAIHSQGPDDWTLKIKFVQPRDAGMYECQVSTHPPQSIFVTLNVIEAHAEITGGPDKYIKSGSTLRLICELKQSTEEPSHVFWYQGIKMINYDPSRNIEVTHDRYSSTLVIYNVEKSDSGNYSCSPSNASPASIFVHIINGENPAAMQHGSHSTVCVPSPPLWCLSLILSLTLQQLYFHYLNNYHCSSYHQQSHHYCHHHSSSHRGRVHSSTSSKTQGKEVNKSNCAFQQASQNDNNNIIIARMMLSSKSLLLSSSPSQENRTSESADGCTIIKLLKSNFGNSFTR